MKRILIVMTVMLRVFWSSYPNGDSPMSGIYLGTYSIRGSLVRMDDGSMVRISTSNIERTKWVEVKAEK